MIVTPHAPHADLLYVKRDRAISALFAATYWGISWTTSDWAAIIHTKIRNTLLYVWQRSNSNITRLSPDNFDYYSSVTLSLSVIRIFAVYWYVPARQFRTTTVPRRRDSCSVLRGWGLLIVLSNCTVIGIPDAGFATIVSATRIQYTASNTPRSSATIRILVFVLVSLNVIIVTSCSSKIESGVQRVWRGLQ